MPREHVSGDLLMKACKIKGLLSAFVLAGMLIMTACENEKTADSNVDSSISTESISGETETVLSTEKEEVKTEPSIPDESEEEISTEEAESEENMVLKLTESYKGLDHNNPLMTQKYGADPYAMVYGDRVYFYMTADAYEYDRAGNIVENSYGQIRSINVISTDDMVNFTDHGSIQVAGSKGAAKWANNSWAPAAAWKNIDGKDKFFLYFANSGGGIGVLTADSPTGPFTDPLGEALISRSTPNCWNVEWLFDPAVLVDDDGRAYIYFGGGIPQGKIADPGTARVVELGADMISIKGEPIRVEAPYLFEDSGIHKYNNKYYYTYCSNWQVDQAGTDKYGFYNAEIVCMESDSPMGPFVYKETILQNPGRVFGLYGNNHHCVFEFKGNWYMTYHARTLEKYMGIEKGYRSTHVDEFTMQEDGSIGKIKMTLKGRKQLKYVDPYKLNNAATMAVMGGITCVPCDYDSVITGCGTMAISDIQTGDFIKLQGVDFGEESPKSVLAVASNDTGLDGKIQFRLDKADGELLAVVTVSSIDKAGGMDYTAEMIGTATGVHDLYLIFEGEGFNVEAWQFEK